jgi:hypothetical protein
MEAVAGATQPYEADPLTLPGRDQSMRPVWQTRRSDVDGNCFEACVASLLELDDVEAVPRYRDSNESMNRYLAEDLDPWLA